MDLSFSERLTNIFTLSTNLLKSGYDSEECRSQARILEEDIFEKATSKNEYQSHFERLVISLQPLSEAEVDRPGDTDDTEILNTDGPTIGDYEFVTFHKDGQMSTVFKARTKDQHATERIVALKITHPAQMVAPHNSTREARILIDSRHAHIVPLLESFSEPNSRFVLVFPFLRQDLENLLRSQRLDRKQRGQIFTAMFSALSHLHSRGIIHRDVKPSNILLRTMEGPVYLADFGIAWSPQDRDSEDANQKITDVGTTCYRSPELLFGNRSYDESLDIWAAGCVVAEMIKRGHEPLFDAGPLGSELGLIKSIFTTLGTPNDVSWPSAKRYPDWGKMRFKEFPPKSWTDIIPGVSTTAIDFLSKTVCYENTFRLKAAEALEHPLSSEIGLI